jgi:protein-tyrosine-phosphatase
VDVSTRKPLPGLDYPEEYLGRLSADLTQRFAGVFSPETVDRYVLESYASLLRTAKVKAHLATQTTRFATDRLTALAQSAGALPSPLPEVLFVCEQNAGRSQMAAALTAQLGAGRVHVRSAGSMPAEQISPAVAQAMSELGLDLADEFPKPLTDDVVRAADVVITMGCGDACPIYPGKRYLDWELTDPSGLGIDDVRPIRDDIKGRVRALLAELGAAG